MLKRLTERHPVQPAASAAVLRSAPMHTGLFALQRLAGNQAVAGLLASRHTTSAHRCAALEAGAHAPSSLPVQRDCGPTCGCESCGPSSLDAEPVEWKPPVTVQRHTGWRTKNRLETPELKTLQFAASRTERALERGKSRGAEVTRLQEALSKAKFPVRSTGEYDEATRAAVAAFQRAHGVPYPSGRQAGPKTLSTLDDHLLGKPTPPKPDKRCDQYESKPDERRESLTTKGLATRSGTFGKELRLYNFGAGKDSLKLEHEQALKDFIREFDLADPCNEQWAVDEVIGFTDPIDSEADNEVLRMLRAFSVSDFIQQHGVPDAPDGIPGGPSSVCSKSERTLARAVVVRLKRLPKPTSPKCSDPKPPSPPKPHKNCVVKTSTKWSLQGVLQGGPPLEGGGAASAVAFMLRAKDERIGYTLATQFIVFRGAGGGASLSFPVTVPLPSETGFSTPAPRHFDDFNGRGWIRDEGGSAGIGYSIMKGRLPIETEPQVLDLSGWQFGLGLGFEQLLGYWTVVPGCF